VKLVAHVVSNNSAYNCVVIPSNVFLTQYEVSFIHKTPTAVHMYCVVVVINNIIFFLVHVKNVSFCIVNYRLPELSYSYSA
jgi:hypothetical protein